MIFSVSTAEKRRSHDDKKISHDSRFLQFIVGGDKGSLPGSGRLFPETISDRRRYPQSRRISGISQ